MLTDDVERIATTYSRNIRGIHLIPLLWEQLIKICCAIPSRYKNWEVDLETDTSHLKSSSSSKDISTWYLYLWGKKFRLKAPKISPETGMVKLWERLPPSNVLWFNFRTQRCMWALFVSCWFSFLLLGFSVFLPLQKPLLQITTRSSMRIFLLGWITGIARGFACFVLYLLANKKLHLPHVRNSSCTIGSKEALKYQLSW